MNPNARRCWIRRSVVAGVAVAAAVAVIAATAVAAMARQPCLAALPARAPSTAYLLGIDAFDRTIWAVGSPASASRRSLILRSNGHRVELMANPGRGELRAVLALSNDNVWAVGETTFLHWDGRVWQPAAAPIGRYASYWGISGSAPDNVWAVGTQSGGFLVVRWDGRRWTRVPFQPVVAMTKKQSPNQTQISMSLLNAALVLGRDDVWLGGLTVTKHPFTSHWDGRRWRTTVLPWMGSTDTLAGASSDDVWVGDAAWYQAFHWNGQRWQRFRDPGAIDFAFARGRLWAISQWALWRWTGRHWLHVSRLPITNLGGLTADSRGNLWVAGGADVHALLLRYRCT